MNKVILIRYAEIALKGKNRIDFERQLVRNIKDCLRKNKVRFYLLNPYRFLYGFFLFVKKISVWRRVESTLPPCKKRYAPSPIGYGFYGANVKRIFEKNK